MSTLQVSITVQHLIVQLQIKNKRREFDTSNDSQILLPRTKRFTDTLRKLRNTGAVWNFTDDRRTTNDNWLVQRSQLGKILRDSSEQF